jgi:hypothetical protein
MKREFNKDKILKICEKLNIMIKTGILFDKNMHPFSQEERFMVKTDNNYGHLFGTEIKSQNSHFVVYCSELPGWGTFKQAISRIKKFRYIEPKNIKRIKL